VIKGYFVVCVMIAGAVMSSAYGCGSKCPLALMLSADPYPNQLIALCCAVNAAGIRIKPRSSHHLVVTLDSFVALGLF
jgi:hypothetical protein